MHATIRYEVHFSALGLAVVEGWVMVTRFSGQGHRTGQGSQKHRKLARNRVFSLLISVETPCSPLIREEILTN